MHNNISNAILILILKGVGNMSVAAVQQDGQSVQSVFKVINSKSD